MVNLFSSASLSLQTTGGATAPGLLAAEANNSETAIASGDFAELLNTESSMVEMLEALKMLLSTEEFAQLEKMLAEGQTLPAEEILAALKQQLSEASAEGATAGSIAEQTETPLPVEQAIAPITIGTMAVPVPIAANQVAAIQAANRKTAQPVATGQAAIPSNVGNDAASLSFNLNNASADPNQQPPTEQLRISEAMLAQAAQKTPINNLFRTTDAGLTVLNAPFLASGGGGGNTPLAIPSQINTALLMHTPMGEKGWSQAMGERILWMVGRQVQGAEVRITPPQLGPVDIRIFIRNDQANVTFTAQHGVVREALEASIPRLREMLSENNLQLTNVDVNQRNAGEGRASSHSFNQPSLDKQDAEGYEVENNELAVSSVHTIQSDGLVDDFA